MFLEQLPSSMANASETMKTEKQIVKWGGGLRFKEIKERNCTDNSKPLSKSEDCSLDPGLYIAQNHIKDWGGVFCQDRRKDKDSCQLLSLRNEIFFRSTSQKSVIKAINENVSGL